MTFEISVHRISSILGLSVVLAIGCASTNGSSSWSISSIERLREAYDFKRICRGAVCSLIVKRGDDPFEITLDGRCATAEAEICVWRDGLIQLFVPRYSVAMWTFGGQQFRLKEQIGQRRLIEQFKKGKFYAAYLIDGEAGDITYVINEDEVCVQKEVDTLRCFSIDHGNYLAFNLQL
ncbi:MAG: hypothetical protein ABL957_14710 [Parvularculaceae bacterium]